MRFPSDGSPLIPTSDIPLMGDGSDQPAPDTDALNKLLPAARRGGQGVMFNAVLKMAQTGLNFLWYRYGAKINAQKSALFSDGEDLAAWGKYYKRPQQPDEQDSDYRTRLLSPLAIITPAAIIDAVKAQVIQTTTIPPVILEPAIDAGFAAPTSFASGVPNWSSFAQPTTRRLWAQDDSRPGVKAGSYVVPVVTTPLFWVLTPDVGDDSLAPHAMDVAGAQADPTVDFVNGSSYSWQAQATMVAGLLYHAAVKLQDGRVVVIGGQSTAGGSPSASVYAWSPITGIGTALASLNTGRSRHGAVVLDTGEIIVMGGTTSSNNSSGWLSSVELYDPNRNTWTTLATSMNTPRAAFGLVRLRDRRVMVIGGTTTGGGIATTSEAFAPWTGAWTNSAGSTGGIFGSDSAFALLPSGNVLACGGGGSAVKVTAVYTVATNAWATVANMNVARLNHSARLLPRLGQVMVVGGWDGISTAFSSVEAYDEGSNTWTNWPSMPHARYGFPMFVLGSGLVVCAGGYPLSSGLVDQMDPLMGSWVSLGSMSERKGLAAGILMPGDEPLVIGGDNGTANFSAAAERFSPTLTFWNSVPQKGNTLFDRIISEVQPRRAAGFPWVLLAEPLLGNDA